jgi:hypothetical protein
MNRFEAIPIPYTGQRQVKFNAIGNNVLPVFRNNIIKRLNTQQQKVNAKLAEDAFLMEQARLLQREYEKEQKKLEQQRIQQAIEQRQILDEQKRQQKRLNYIAGAAKRKAAREAAKTTEMIADSNRTGHSDDIEFNNFYKKFAGMVVRLVNIVGGKVIHDIEGTFITYKQFRKFILEVSGLGYNESPSALSGRWIAFAPSKITAKQIIQKFRDGEVHCVFHSILTKLQSMLDSTSSVSVKKRLAQRIAAIQKYQKEYDFVPEDKMEEIYKVAGLKMTRYDVMDNETIVYNKDGKVGALRTKNTRINHIDEIVMDCDYEIVSMERMKELYDYSVEQYKLHKTFYHIDGNIKEGVPIKLRTPTGAYKLSNPIADACIAFDNEIDIPSYRLNAIKNPELNEFIKAGRIINAWSNDINGGDAESCADMPAAYTQFKKCKFYNGFMGHIQQFRSGNFSLEFIKNYIGYYRITITGGIDWLMSKVGFTIGGSYVLFSQEILYYASLGVTFTSDVGAWGSRFDFEFSPAMLENRLYCHWTGRLGMEYTHTSTTFPCDIEFAAHLKCSYDIFYYKEHELATIKTPCENVYTSHHIFGAITAYTRIQMMEAMRQFEPNQICRVVMDGIYYNGTKPAGLDWFKNKPGRVAASYSNPWYENVSESVANPITRIINNSSLLGQGGSGKSHSILADKGFIDVLYVAPTQLLGLQMAKKYGCRWTTIHKLIGIGCVPYYKEHTTPSTILGDELSMWLISWVQSTESMYKNCLLLFAGDIDLNGHAYQCTISDGDVKNPIWKPTGYDIIYYENDYRSKDEALKALKLKIRSQMDLIHDDEINHMIMKMWALQHLPIADSITDFVEGRDTVIAGTHNTNKKLLQNGVVSGWYKKGGHISSTSVEGYEKRGSFTIHSYQGQTIETGNVWIVIDDMFDYAMLYTAVSRCVRFEQLRFVKAI